MSTTNINDLLKRIQEKDPTFQPKMNLVQKQYDRVEHIKPVTTEDITAMPTILTEYALTPILPAPGLMMIFAYAGVGKTKFALNLAYAIATGSEFLKYKCPLPRKVLYVDGEVSLANIQSRLVGLQAAYGKAETPDMLNILTCDMIKPPFTIPSIDVPEDQQFYEQLILRENYDVIFFDNLSMLTGMEENSSSDWKRIQDWLIYLRKIGKTIIILHHSGKDKKGYRGTSRMIDAMNTAISLQIDTNAIPHPSYGLPTFTLHYEKHRDFEHKDAKPFDVFECKGQWGWQDKEISQFEQVEELYNAKMTQRQIATETGLSLSKVNRVIKKAEYKNKK